MNMNTLTKLEYDIIKWARERKIFDNPNPIAQHNKTVEEVLELRDAIIRRETYYSQTQDEENLTEIKDGIGDTIVTLTLLANMHGLNLTDCVQHAYDEIKDRTGKTVNGTFIKD